jgi:hypothetical protein
VRNLPVAVNLPKLVRRLQKADLILKARAGQLALWPKQRVTPEILAEVSRARVELSDLLGSLSVAGSETALHQLFRGSAGRKVELLDGRSGILRSTSRDIDGLLSCALELRGGLVWVDAGELRFPETPLLGEQWTECTG